MHRNSDKPAEFDAETYAQGNEIHLGPGHEKHLEHELGHVVQQKQGQVLPTNVENGMPVNENPALEDNAESLQISNSNYTNDTSLPVVQFSRKKRSKNWWLHPKPPKWDTELSQQMEDLDGEDDFDSWTKSKRIR